MKNTALHGISLNFQLQVRDYDLCDGVSDTKIKISEGFQAKFDRIKQWQAL